MLHPSDHQAPAIMAVRDGQSAPVTCAACGCRLDMTPDSGFVHFGRFAGRDARGCRVHCIESLHDARGLPLVALPA